MEVKKVEDYTITLTDNSVIIRDDILEVELAITTKDFSKIVESVTESNKT